MSIIAEDQVTITLIDDGKSAYETAIESGYSGTEEEFSSDLARTSEIAEKANSSEVFGTTVYTYISGSTTYDVYKEGEDEEGETARYYYLNANDEKVYVTESQLEHDENDELISRVEGSMLEGVNMAVSAAKTTADTARTEASNAAKVATDFLMSANGLWVTPSNAKPNSSGVAVSTTSGVHIKDFVEIVRAGVSQIWAGLENAVAIIRVGAANIANIVLKANDGIELRQGNSVMASFSNNIISLGKNLATTANKARILLCNEMGAITVEDIAADPVTEQESQLRIKLGPNEQNLAKRQHNIMAIWNANDCQKVLNGSTKTVQSNTQIYADSKETESLTTLNSSLSASDSTSHYQLDSGVYCTNIINPSVTSRYDAATGCSMIASIGSNSAQLNVELGEANNSMNINGSVITMDADHIYMRGDTELNTALQSLGWTDCIV